ncbi:MAG: fasciclin domain-containing protein [Paludibacteraceae bacterium]|nr:fasciclin domain-containing protein [Paludibacteraceae bacterium]
MKKFLTIIRSLKYKTLLSLILTSVLINSCTNDFDYLSNNKPTWLGESIYEQLQLGYIGEDGTKHTFTTFLKLIDDIGYSEVLKKTGSKTLFVSDDAAFDRFYTSNNWGVSSYEGFSIAQKKLILNSAMINNAYLVELLSNTEGPVEGQALRRTTAISYIDSVNFENPADLPENNKHWDLYRDNGLYLLKDNSPIPMLHFLQRQMNFKGMTNEDFAVLFNGKTREKDDAHIYGIKIIERDITCKNGYINILEDVLIPPTNMAEIIRTTPETQIFSRILDRYSAPYYSEVATSDFQLLNPGYTDSIFVKRYFAERSSGGANLANPKGIVQAGYLEYDPGWNTYNLNYQMQTDMAAMFVPTNETMSNFFNNGGGKFLIEKFKTIDSIPNDVLDDLLRNHMKSSFLGTLPNRFNEIMDDGKEPMGVSKSDVVKTFVGNNGVVYVTNKIYAPASYVAVTAPILIHDNTKLFNLAVKNLQFDAYLLSMDSHYSFIVPLDIPNANDSLGNGLYYIDPVSYAKTESEIFKFWFKAPNTIAATVYEYIPGTGQIGDSLRLATAAEISNRFNDILDYHIVVGDIESGKQYYRTKGGGQLKINYNGDIKIQGGGNIENNKSAQVNRIYDQTKATNGRGNGKTYLVDSPLLPPYRSVYKILSEEPQFSEFFKLLQGNDEAPQTDIDKYAIFYKDKKYVGMDFNVKFFNTFHYSVYVPTNEAVQTAIADGLPTWDIIKLETNQALKDSLSAVLVNFLKYHFQDNSVYIDGSTTDKITYETAAYTLIGKKAYYKIGTKLSADNLTLYTNANSTTTINKENGLYNIMAREYKFNNADIEKATAIETSSWAVIHQINDVLLYEPGIMNKMRQLTKKSKAKTKTVTSHRTVK